MFRLNNRIDSTHPIVQPLEVTVSLNRVKASPIPASGNPTSTDLPFLVNPLDSTPFLWRPETPPLYRIAAADSSPLQTFLQGMQHTMQDLAKNYSSYSQDGEAFTNVNQRLSNLSSRADSLTHAELFSAFTALKMGALTLPGTRTKSGGNPQFVLLKQLGNFLEEIEKKLSPNNAEHFSELAVAYKELAEICKTTRTPSDLQATYYTAAGDAYTRATELYDSQADTSDISTRQTARTPFVDTLHKADDAFQKAVKIRVDLAKTANTQTNLATIQQQIEALTELNKRRPIPQELATLEELLAKTYEARKDSPNATRYYLAAARSYLAMADQPSAFLSPSEQWASYYSKAVQLFNKAPHPLGMLEAYFKFGERCYAHIDTNITSSDKPLFEAAASKAFGDGLALLTKEVSIRSWLSSPHLLLLSGSALEHYWQLLKKNPSHPKISEVRNQLNTLTTHLIRLIPSSIDSDQPLRGDYLEVLKTEHAYGEEVFETIKFGSSDGTLTPRVIENYAIVEAAKQGRLTELVQHVLSYSEKDRPSAQSRAVLFLDVIAPKDSMTDPDKRARRYREIKIALETASARKRSGSSEKPGSDHAESHLEKRGSLSEHISFLNRLIDLTHHMRGKK